MIETIQKIRAAFPNAVLNETFFRDEYSLTIAISSLRDICLHARDVLGFNYLIDVSSVDHFGEEPRFEMVYELYTLRNEIHLRLKTEVSEDDNSIATVSDIWPTADWHEREIYDMMGIKFAGHPDLRHILMWEGYPYFPLRKEFPLAGKPSEMPDVASTGVAPMEGGPFVTSAGADSRVKAEPRAR